jgi:hypothetical protein
VLFGESKSRLSKSELNRFLKVKERLRDILLEQENAHDLYLLMVVHRVVKVTKRL